MPKELPLITAIVTAYNIAEYLPACLESLLKQSYENLEIVVIDDGSTDRTSQICAEYKSREVIAVHQKNAGLSAARNTGIKHARGEYLAFIDGDDLVSRDFIKRLYEAAQSTSSEISVCDFIEFTEVISRCENYTSDIKTYSSKEAVISLLTGQENRDIIVCNKLYKKELFKDIKFPVGELHEDNLTTYKLIASANKVASINEPLYYYRRHSGSITAVQNILSSLRQKERAAKEAIEYFDNTPDLKQAARVALLLSKFAYLDNVASGKIHDQNLWQKTVKEIKNSKKAYLKNPYLTKKLRLYLGLLTIPRVYKLFRKIIH